MKPLFFLIIVGTCIIGCRDGEDNTVVFSNEEISPVVTFTHNNKPVKISNTNSGLWTSDKAVNEKGEEIQGKSTKGFGSVIDSDANGRNQATILISKWVSDVDVDYIIPNASIEVIKPKTFRSIFNTGTRLYAKNANPVNTTNEVLIEYFDENAIYWSSSYQGNSYSTPPYTELQPSSVFTIIRSMPIGNDTVFVEGKFKVRLYRNEKEYVDISDGYFKGYYYRRP